MGEATLHRWDDLPSDAPMPLITRQRVIGEKLMISRVELKKGFRVESHQHANEQFVVLLSGKVKFTIGQAGSAARRELLAEGGQVLVLPPNVPHAAHALEDTLILDLFSPPSEKTGVDQ